MLSEIFGKPRCPGMGGLIWLTLVNKKHQFLPQRILWGVFINHCKGGVKWADHQDGIDLFICAFLSPRTGGRDLKVPLWAAHAG